LSTWTGHPEVADGAGYEEFVHSRPVEMLALHVDE
jgi:hypothetical protein